MNQLSIYGVVSNWCEQCSLTEEEQGPKGVLTSVKSHEVNLLVSSPRQASGSSFWENIQDFESLSETIRSSKECEDAIFVHRVSAGMSYKTRLDEDDGFWADHFILPRTTLSRVNPRSRVFAAIPGGTIIGPVVEVQFVKILDSCGLEFAIPSRNDPRWTSFCSDIQRKESVRGRIAYSQCRSQTRGITL